jgi:hypothetical protein
VLSLRYFRTLSDESFSHPNYLKRLDKKEPKEVDDSDLIKALEAIKMLQIDTGR